MKNGGDEASPPFLPPFARGPTKRPPPARLARGVTTEAPPFPPFVKNGGNETFPPFAPRFARGVTKRQQPRSGNTTRPWLRSGSRARAPDARRDSRRVLPARRASSDRPGPPSWHRPPE